MSLPIHKVKYSSAQVIWMAVCMTPIISMALKPLCVACFICL